MKQCSRCKLLKNITDFTKNCKNTDRLHNCCRSCSYLFAKESKKRHPEMNKLHSRKYHLKHSYGMTLEDEKAFKEKHNNCCDICKATLGLCIDHSHLTKKVRGLLCRRCNAILGMAIDSPIILLKAIDYLNLHVA